MSREEPLKKSESRLVRLSLPLPLSSCVCRMSTTVRARCHHILRAILAQVLLVALLVTNADAQLVTTIAGGGEGHADGVGTNAQFTSLTGISVDPSTGTLFVADEFYLRSMNLTSGLVTTFAGGGQGKGPIDGAGTNAIFNSLGGVTVMGDTVFVSDIIYNGYNCGVIRTVMTLSAVVSTWVGGDGDIGLGEYLSFAVDSLSTNLYVADSLYNTIRSVSSSGLVSTIAGDSGGGLTDGTGTNAWFYFPGALTVDSLGTVYICDCDNHAIRAMKGDSVSTFVGKAQVSGFQDGVGSNAYFYRPSGITVDVSNILYVADTGNFKIRRITPDGVVTTFVGGGTNGVTPGYADGLGTNAYFNYPYSITIDKPGSTLYVTDLEKGPFSIIRSVALVPTPSQTSSLSPTSSTSSSPSLTLTGSPSPSSTASPSLTGSPSLSSSPSPTLTGSPSAAAAAAAPPQTSTVATNIATSFGCAIGGGLVVLLAQEGLRQYRAGRLMSAREVKEQQLPKFAASGFSGAHSAPLLGVSDGVETSLN